MKTLKLAALLSVGLAAPVLAEGDAAVGEEQFIRQCVSCHVIANDAGEVLAGRSGRTGPNLFNLGGHVIGGVDGFRYGESILAVNATGATWTEETLASYLLDPTEWLRTTLDDRRARSKMSFRVRSETDAADISAYLLTFSE